MFFKRKTSREDLKYERVQGYKVIFISRDFPEFSIKNVRKTAEYYIDIECIAALQKKMNVDIGPFDFKEIRHNSKKIIFEILPIELRTLYKLTGDLESAFAMYFDDNEITRLSKTRS